MAEDLLSEVVEIRLADAGDHEGLHAGEDEISDAHGDISGTGDGDDAHRAVVDEAVVDHPTDQGGAGQRGGQPGQQHDEGDDDAAPVGPQRRHDRPEEARRGDVLGRLVCWPRSAAVLPSLEAPQLHLRTLGSSSGTLSMPRTWR